MKRATLQDCVVCWAYRREHRFPTDNDQLDWHVDTRQRGRWSVTSCKTHEVELAASMLRING